MNYLCLIGGIIAFILAVQLGRINSKLSSIEKNLDRISIHTSKEYNI